MIKQFIKKYTDNENIEKARVLTSPIKMYETLESVQEYFNRTTFKPEKPHEIKLAASMKDLGFKID